MELGLCALEAKKEIRPKAAGLQERLKVSVRHTWTGYHTDSCNTAADAATTSKD